MDKRFEDLGRLILRIGVAGLLLIHGVTKLQNGIGFVQTQVGAAGLPAFVANGVYIGEVIAPILVLIGLFTRPAALIMAFDLLGAIVLARSGDVATISRGGGLAVETELLFIFGSMAIACFGAGKFALGSGRVG